MICNHFIKCAACLDRTECAHTGARWLCKPCFIALLGFWPGDKA